MCLFQDVILDRIMVVDDKLSLVLFSFRVCLKRLLNTYRLILRGKKMLYLRTLC